MTLEQHDYLLRLIRLRNRYLAEGSMFAAPTVRAAHQNALADIERRIAAIDSYKDGDEDVEEAQ